MKSTKLLATVKSGDQNSKDRVYIVNQEHISSFIEHNVSSSSIVIFSSYIPEYEPEK